LLIFDVLMREVLVFYGSSLQRLPAPHRHLQGRQATQAALTHNPTLASASLAQGSG